MGRSMVVVLVVLAALAFGERPARAAADLDAIDRAAERVLDHRYQSLDPDGRVGGRAGGRAGSEAPAAEREQPRRRDGDSWGQGGERAAPTVAGPGSGLGGLLSWLVWGGLAVGAILLVLFLVRELTSRRGRAAEPEAAVEEEPAPPPPAALERPLDDAEQLALAGRYAEAIHVLLLRTFEELARAADVRIAPALTSREILARIPLRPFAGEALAELVGAVERSWFGDHVPDEADWRRCRRAFETFVAAYRAPAPRLVEAA
jgi:hypothetical protein